MATRAERMRLAGSQYRGGWGKYFSIGCALAFGGTAFAYPFWAVKYQGNLTGLGLNVEQESAFPRQASIRYVI